MLKNTASAKDVVFDVPLVEDPNAKHENNSATEEDSNDSIHIPLPISLMQLR
jgi:hypothetical protein